MVRHTHFTDVFVVSLFATKTGFLANFNGLYYFFDDNCAYRIVRIIEAIRPEWTVSNHTIYAIPGEIVKNLFNEESIVRKIKVKPSLKRKVMAQYQSMTEEEKLKSKRLVQLVSDETSLEVSSANAKILSFANLYFENLRQRKKGKLTQKENKRWNEIQKALSQSSEKVMLATPQKVTTQPELGHNSYAVRAQLVNNLKLNRSYLHLDLQSAYHDLKNIDLAYSPFSQLIFPSIQFRADDKKIYFDKLTFVDIISLTPYTWIDPQVSWQARVFAKSYSFYDESIQNILVGRVGAGLSIEPLNQKLLFFQVGAQNESARLDESYQSLFLTTGILANFSEKIKTGLIATRFFKGRDQTVQYHTESEVEQFVTYSWRRNLEIRQSLAWSKFQTEADLAKKSENLEILFGPSFYF